MTDNSGNNWLFMLDGREVQVPGGIQTLVGSDLSSARYAAKWAGNGATNVLDLKAHARINKLGFNVEVQYEGGAYMLGRIPGKSRTIIELRTRSLRIVSVDA